MRAQLKNLCYKLNMSKRLEWLRAFFFSIMNPVFIHFEKEFFAKQRNVQPQHPLYSPDSCSSL